MAISLIQQGNNNGGGTSFSVSVSATGANHLLVVGIQGFYSSSVGVVSSVTDNAGNTYTQVSGAQGVASTTRFTDMWYCPNCLAGATSITVHFSQTTGAATTAVVNEYSGGKTTAPFVDTSATLNNQNTSPVGPSLTITGASDVLVAVISPASIALTSVNSPWGHLVASTMADAIPLTTGTFQAVFNPTTSQVFCSSGAAFFAQSLILGLSETQGTSDTRINNPRIVKSEVEASSDNLSLSIPTPGSLLLKETGFLSDLVSTSPILASFKETIKMNIWNILDKQEPRPWD